MLLRYERDNFQRTLNFLLKGKIMKCTRCTKAECCDRKDEIIKTKHSNKHGWKTRQDAYEGLEWETG